MSLIDFADGFNTMRMGIFGASGRGKSYLATQMLMDRRLLKGKYDEIILIHPEYEFEREGENWKKLKIDRIYLEFSQELVDDIIQETRDKFRDDRNFKRLLVLDDCVSEESFSNKNRSALSKAFTNSRKIGLSILLISQRLSLVGPTIHSQLNYIIIFKTGFGRELETIEKSYGFVDKKLWREMIKTIFVEKRDTLMINTDDEIYYRNFNLLKINNEK